MHHISVPLLHKYYLSLRILSNSKKSIDFYTLHVFQNGVYMPAVFFILKDSMKSTYKAMFAMIEEEARSMGLLFNIADRSFVFDFEASIINALRELNVKKIRC